MGVVYLAEQDEPGEALRSYERLVGKDHPDVGVITVNLGGVYRDAGDFEASQRYFERSYEIFESKLPQGHPYLVHALSQWAKLLRKTGDETGAERMEARAAEMQDG